MRPFIPIHLFAPLFLILHVSTVAAQDPAVETTTPSKQPNVLWVRPIRLCDDDGDNAAHLRLPKKFLDHVFKDAKLEVLYLNPQRWNFGQGRRGETELAAIVAKGKQDKVLSRDPRILNLIFVSAMDGKKQLAARGIKNSNDCFVCLSSRKENLTDIASRLAVEIGHCFNLKKPLELPQPPKAKEQPPNQVTPTEWRPDVALSPQQTETISQSPLYLPKIHFFDRAETEQELIDESWQPYLSSSYEHMLRYTLGLAPRDPLPAGPDARLAFARQKVVEFADEFTEKEKMFLRTCVADFEEVIGDRWPMLCRTPWNFVKVEQGFYNGASHTRGLCIFLAPSGLEYMKRDPLYASWVLAHEKIHILQRINEQDYHPFYRQLGYQRFEFDEASIAALQFKQNPDAFSYRWAYPIEGKLYHYATSLKPAGRKGFRKFNQLVPLERIENQTFKALPKVDMAVSSRWNDRFLIMDAGYEGPNELIAYFANYLVSRYMNEWQPTPANQKMLDRAETFFDRKLIIVSDDD